MKHETQIFQRTIIAMIKSHEASAKASNLCRRYGISDATFYKCKSKFGGMTVPDAKKLRALEEVNGDRTESAYDNHLYELGAGC